MNREEHHLKLLWTPSCCPAIWGKPERKARLSQEYLMPNRTPLEPADSSCQHPFATKQLEGVGPTSSEKPDASYSSRT